MTTYDTVTAAAGVTAVPDGWTAEELASVRGDLQREADDLRVELDAVVKVLDQLVRDGGEGAGDDQADAGSATFEREQEMSLANNKRALLEQTERAITRIDTGAYGSCEICGSAIPKGRLQARPKVTLCVTCQQREARR